MIKLIATDMDGTWLTDQKDYDKELFLREFAEMQKQGIKFVVASGNQYANLMTRFPEVLDKIYFVAENGALVAQGRQILHVDSLSDDIYQTLLKITTEYPYPAVVMGLVSAYVKKSSGRAYKQEMKKYMELDMADMETEEIYAKYNMANAKEIRFHHLSGWLSKKISGFVEDHQSIIRDSFLQTATASRRSG